MAYSIETLASTRRKRKETSRVESLIPSGLRDESAALIELLKSYYEYMNLSGNPSYEINSINNARDIDLIDEKYLALLQKEIAAAIPKNVQIDKVKLYKSLLQYYSVRGSVDSIRLFFKILFQDNVQIYYPREDMLIPSSGNWGQTIEQSRYVGNTLVGSQGIQGVQFIQSIQAGTQTINGVQGIQFIQGIQGVQFVQGVQFIQGVQGITAAQGVQFIQSIQGVTQAGQYIQGVQGIQGTPDRIPTIQAVTHLGVQDIQGVQFIQGVTGVQFIQTTTQAIQAVTGVTGVQGIQGILGAYVDNKGFLSDTIKLQDSYFYQQFSYVIQTGNNTDTWKNEFNRLVHPAGFIFFGQIVIFIENVNAFPVDIIQELDLWLSGYQKVNGEKVPLSLEKLNVKLLNIIDGRDDVRIYSSMRDHQPGLVSDEDLPVPIFVGFAESITDGLSGEPFNRKDRCVAATTANITLSGPQTIDGRAVIAGDRVLVKNQTVTSENGIYQVPNSGAWTRTTDADVRDELVSAFVFIPHGSSQHRNTAWVCTVGNGAVTALAIGNAGSGYTSAPAVTIAAPPAGGTQATATAILAGTVVTALRITNAGTGYTSAPAVTIEAPPAGGTQATATSTIFVGGALGTASLIWNESFVIPQAMIPFTQRVSTGYGATATATVANGAVTGLTVTYLTPSNTALQQNERYTHVPSVVFSGGGGSGATATATINGQGGVATLAVTAAGENYASASAVTISAPPAGGTQATATATINGQGGVATLAIGNPGSGYTSAPTVTIAGASGAAATATLLNGVVTGLTITAPGIGYTIAPIVTIVSGGDSTTYLRTIFTNASLRSAHKLGVMTPVYDSTVFEGTHFTLLFDQVPIASANSAHPEMLVKRYQSIGHFFDPGTEMHTYANYTIEQADSNVITYQIPWNNVGSLISNAATFTGSIASTTLTVTAITEGTIHIGSTIFRTGDVVTSLTVTAGGSGYTSAPTVTISSPGGSGTQATATATINEQGVVTALAVGNPGSGYTSTPTVTISGGDGANATATATLIGGAAQVIPQTTITAQITGSVTAVTVTTGGTGYTSAPAVTIAAPPAGGTQATATATLTGDAVTGFTITSPGSGYTSAPTVTISGDGSGATATATASGGIGTYTVSNSQTVASITMTAITPFSAF